ncbi:unnamed protein product [Euphydryas editha]|uniref:Uncharacterized protein n=1 Tax=Euphydryas editha TaxID=104508 RepID=A0AAU9UYG4_EUPED|nr:unnamed protein product [Euphydryas editha]
MKKIPNRIVEARENSLTLAKRTSIIMRFMGIVENPDKIKHPAPLHPDVQIHVKPIFEDLFRDILFERCLGHHTQNANENFNSTIWRLCPKHLNSGLKNVKISACYIYWIIQ